MWMLDVGGNRFCEYGTIWVVFLGVRAIGKDRGYGRSWIYGIPRDKRIELGPCWGGQPKSWGGYY